MSNDEIRELIQLVTDTGIAELEVERGNSRVRIRRAFSASDVVLTSSAAAPIPAPALSTPAPTPALTADTPRPKTEPTLLYVKAPIVGTFYEAASPEAAPFVAVGDHVTPGKVLCIIESMKLMNEIETDVAGIVETKLVQNGQPVEYGEALFGIRPV
jgi:acetyl-CoA carboxylase biotin carboxyl carrier protein